LIDVSSQSLYIYRKDISGETKEKFSKMPFIQKTFWLATEGKVQRATFHLSDIAEGSFSLSRLTGTFYGTEPFETKFASLMRFFHLHFWVLWNLLDDINLLYA